MNRLADLKPGCCKWPVREDTNGHWFCAEGVARAGLSYCAAHMIKAFRKAARRQTQAERMALIKVTVARWGMLRSTPVADGERGVAGADQNLLPDEKKVAVTSPEEIIKFPGESNDIDRIGAAEEITSAPPSEKTLRPIEPICLGGAKPEPIATGEPIFEHANPADLLVEESYQRDLSPKSVALVRKIALNWDWRKFRPPVVVFTDAGVLIVDGQHTTMAAASRGLESIPIQIVEAPEVEARAEAFIGLNRDRLQVTPVQLHHAAVAAGNDTAVTIEQVCHRAGVTIVRSAYGAYKWKPGETMAVNAIRDLIDRRGAMKARMILQALAEADCAPVAAHEIKAAEHLFSHEDFAGELDPINEGGASDLALVIKALGDGAAKDAKMFAATHCVPYWKGLAATWFKKCRKRRKAA